MGLIGKIALIGIVSVAVLIAVIWDVQNESRREEAEESKTTKAEDIKKDLGENIKTEETPSPETRQDETPTAIEQPQPPESPARQPAPVVGPDEPTPPGEHVRTPPEEPGPSLPDVTGEGQKYIIQSGDTLSGIARKFYGSAKYRHAIQAANIDIIPDEEVLRVGDEIIIPPKEQVLGEEPKPAPQAVETYIVQEGDNLTKISRMHYGDDTHAELIYQANRDKIKDKNVLTPGTTLVIPPLPKKPR